MLETIEEQITMLNTSIDHAIKMKEDSYEMERKLVKMRGDLIDKKQEGKQKKMLEE